MSSVLEKLEPWQREHVRKEVRGLLQQSDAFSQLPDSARRDLARGLVDVVAFLARPEAAGGALAGALEDKPKPGQQPGPVAGSSPATKQPSAGGGRPGQQQGFGDALRAGAAAYRDMVDAVDFPKFVAGLIDGVFKSIVDASMRQMDAYTKLLASVSKSVDEFAKDNFTPNQGRDYLAGRFPTQLEIKVEGNQPRLVPTAAGEESGLADVRAALGLDKEVDLSSEESEAELASRAQLELAKLRQKQISTMVLLGINRIVVTDGLINAKVVVDVKANDRQTKSKSASSFDDLVENKQTHDGGGWFSSSFEDSQSTHQTIVKSASDETSESKAEAKAKLTGEVRVSFKSETFPLDKMASQVQLDSINDRSRPT